MELSNPGASGSIFYISDDDEFIIKTVQHKEADFLQKLLPGYYMVLHATVLLNNYRFCSVIFVNENENGEKRENNEFVNEN